MAHMVLLLIAQSRALCILVVTLLILWLHIDVHTLAPVENNECLGIARK